MNEDKPGPLLFSADGRVRVTTWVSAQTFLTFFRSARKMDTQWRESKGFKLPIQANRPPLFPIGYEIFPCKGGLFNMATQGAGWILTPKRYEL